MSWLPGQAWPEEVATLLHAAGSRPLLPAEQRPSRTLLDRRAIEGLLPHRGRSLLLDRVTLIDPSQRLVVARYDLADGREVFSEHFPGRPVWPGTLQVEAIGQAGLLLMTRLTGVTMHSEAEPHALTHILWARFARAVVPGGELEVVARVVEDGLFHLVIGQCLKEGLVTAAAALGGL